MIIAAGPRHRLCAITTIDLCLPPVEVWRPGGLGSCNVYCALWRQWLLSDCGFRLSTVINRDLSKAIALFRMAHAVPVPDGVTEVIGPRSRDPAMVSRSEQSGWNAI